jgi:excinuclease ABC subunit B
VAEQAADYAALDPAQLGKKLALLESQMFKHARDLEFEQAAKLRDEIQRLKSASLQSPQ